jgi:hypothetical protein
METSGQPVVEPHARVVVEFCEDNGTLDAEIERL